MEALGAIPIGANSYKYEDDPNQCYRVEVVIVTGVRGSGLGLGLTGWNWSDSWNTGAGFSSGGTVRVFRGDRDEDEPEEPIYYAGICPRALEPLQDIGIGRPRGSLRVDIRLGVVRHDDVVSHSENAATSDARTSGFYAVDERRGCVGRPRRYGRAV